mmetsp:Transcript_52186/g.169509  ORF Transcript_52186/g.169509 Transcript_52186/m.169509 type:complete len:202 (-) Transcript_52186:144-749(-)
MLTKTCLMMLTPGSRFCLRGATSSSSRSCLSSRMGVGTMSVIASRSLRRGGRSVFQPSSHQRSSSTECWMHPRHRLAIVMHGSRSQSWLQVVPAMRAMIAFASGNRASLRPLPTSSDSSPRSAPRASTALSQQRCHNSASQSRRSHLVARMKRQCWAAPGRRMMGFVSLAMYVDGHSVCQVAGVLQPKCLFCLLSSFRFLL